MILFLFALATVFVDVSQAVTHDKVVACYWGAWAFYRTNKTGDGQFDVDNIDASLCTHGFYGFARLSNVTWTVESIDPWYDLAPDDCEEGLCNYDSYRRFTALKNSNPGFKPLISIGGWNEGSKSYSDMAKDPEKRKTFVDSLVPFCKKFGFEGVDLDWEYPGSRDGDPNVDREDYSLLSQEMGDALHAENFLFTAAFTPNTTRLDIGYDIPFISKYLDFINVMCYDYHGWFDGEHPFTGHNAPLFRRVEEEYIDHPGYKFNAFDTINHLIKREAPKEKIIMGMPTFGRGFHLTYGNGTVVYNGLYCPADDGTPMGPYTIQVGILGYNEILEYKNDPEVGKYFEVVRDGCYQAPYAYSDQYWIGYDDVESIEQKTRFANFVGIGGAMIWSLDTDDFKAVNSEETYPLLRAINRIFENGETYDPEKSGCETAPMCDITGDQPILSTPMPSSTAPPNPHGCRAHNDLVAFPGDCHKYLRCVLQDDGSFDTEVHSCGDWVFDPNTSSCADPNLPGNDNLCDDDEE